MSSRAVYRYVPHTIRHVPEGGVSYEAFCTAAGCDAESGLQEDQDAAQQWALCHSGLTGHDLFRRVVSDHARVTRAD
ncbi:hypothetical protein [Streptomyces sp. Ac-502]|uniref:DUF7848 domain-containing protein n=1 Tax=Streptomyces sp. Ac-502 TaxID=3342801 RepID=UPI00386296E9